MSKIIIGDKEQQQIYIYNYYFWQNTFTGTLRLFGGPLMIVLSVWFYLTEANNPILYGTILLAYGLFYSFRPFIYILINREKIDFGVFEVNFFTNYMTIQSDKGLQEYEYTEFKRIKKFSKWYVIYITSTSILALPINQLTPEERLKIDQRTV